MLTPNFQLPAKTLSTFAHTGQAPMPRAGALIGNLRRNSDPIVSHLQEKLRIAVSYFGFDFLRLGMAKRVSQGLARNPVDFIAQHGIKLSLSSFHQYAHARCGAVLALR